jgi:hypothetical protein
MKSVNSTRSATIAHVERWEVSRAATGGLTEGPDGVDRHELVLVGAGAAVEAERDEQEGFSSIPF